MIELQHYMDNQINDIWINAAHVVSVEPFGRSDSDRAVIRLSDGRLYIVLGHAAKIAAEIIDILA